MLDKTDLNHLLFAFNIIIVGINGEQNCMFQIPISFTDAFLDLSRANNQHGIILIGHEFIYK
jgi:hypothetical protein